ncbi:GPW/gp25 family protein [Pantoea sp. JK]|uniref:GPW/gp25 family protein n=1 Tax=Pantoea sp. JK TaxID=2871703 RepID=UPI0022385154|nr:GPW/gp25 family protein [Pantoea sp. JK]MCW6030454.1 GPW/gp25 family protein [Pantoea sp. JK]
MKSLLQCLSDDIPEQPDAAWEIQSNWIYDELRMLFDSRPRMSGAKDNDILKGTILNYGLDESTLICDKKQTKIEMVQQQILELLERFESRLSDVSVHIKSTRSPLVEFVIQAKWQHETLKYLLVWDDAMSIFYLNEMA